MKSVVNFQVVSILEKLYVIICSPCTVNKVIKRITRDCNDEELLKTDSPEALECKKATKTKLK